MDSRVHRNADGLMYPDAPLEPAHRRRGQRGACTTDGIQVKVLGEHGNCPVARRIGRLPAHCPGTSSLVSCASLNNVAELDSHARSAVVGQGVRPTHRSRPADRHPLLQPRRGRRTNASLNLPFDLVDLLGLAASLL